MKKNILLIILISIGTVIIAQGPIDKGESQINFGLGLSTYGLPVYAGFDVGVHEDVTVGGEVSYRSYHNSYYYIKYTHTIIGISGNANYHFNNILEIPSNFDAYAGLNVGFYIWSSSDDYIGDGASGLGIGAQIGGRYYFTDRLSVNLEFGGGSYVSSGKLGLTFRL